MQYCEDNWDPGAKWPEKSLNARTTGKIEDDYNMEDCTDIDYDEDKVTFEWLRLSFYRPVIYIWDSVKVQSS